jgi:hypothetical protein
MRFLSKTSYLPKLEQTLLLLTVGLIPALFAAGFITSIALSVINHSQQINPLPDPGSEVSFTLTECYFVPSKIEAGFVIASLLALAVSSFFVFKKKIRLSLLAYTWPFVLGIGLLAQAVYHQLRTDLAVNPLVVFYLTDYPFSLFIAGSFNLLTLIILWHVKILFEDRFKDKKLMFSLP